MQQARPIHSTRRPFFSVRLVKALILFVFTPLLLESCKGHPAAPAPGAAQADTVRQPPSDTVVVVPMTPVDTAAYNRKVLFLCHGDSSSKFWIRKDYPLPGAILPFKRIVAYYGNLYSRNMGVLGEYPPKIMLAKLMAEVRVWEKADSLTPVQPALHYIAVTAQGSPGRDGKYRARMPFKQIDSVLHMAARINAIVFLDIQVGFSNVQTEVPLLEKYLLMPNVHLGIDAEFAMRPGMRVGKNVGTYDAADVNWCADYLAKLVRAHNLPPKVFIVHRWTEKMITHYKQIRLHPEVQIVMDMDGWGPQQLKRDTYRNYEGAQPVQFTGFKLFYKNDIKTLKKVKFAATSMMTPAQILALQPSPIYIQYQ